MKRLGENIKTLRTTRKMSQDELCKQFNDKYRTNINKGMVSKWENGKEVPRIDYACKLVKFFGVSMDEMFGINIEKPEEDFTFKEMAQIEEFKRYILSKRKQNAS